MRTTIDLPPVTIRGTEYTDRGYCYDAFYDGPVIHTVYCRLDQQRDTAVSSSADCIRSGQDGAAIKAARDAAAEKRRFTPPEYREGAGADPRLKADPIISLAQRQVTEVLALRGRPRTADGTGEWRTWETYTQVDPDYTGFWMAERLHMVAQHMTKPEARAIVDEFSTRVPHYEFRIVRAEIVLKETVIA